MDGEREAARYPKEEGEHASTMDAMDAARRDASKDVESLQAQLDALEKQRHDVKSQLQLMEDRWAVLEKMEQVEDPYNGYIMSLYAHISKIQWDLKRSHIVAGIADNPNTGVLEEFELGEDTGGGLPFETVNRLWDIVQGHA